MKKKYNGIKIKIMIFDNTDILTTSFNEMEEMEEMENFGRIGDFK